MRTQQKGAIRIAGGKFARPQRKKRVWPVMLAACLALVLILGFVAAGLPLIRQAMDPYGGRILSGISVAGVELGGMTQQEAARALSDPQRWKLTLTLPGQKRELSDCGIRVDAGALAKAAYAMGRTQEQQTLEPGPFLTVEESALRSALEEEARTLPQGGSAASWSLEGQLPELSENAFRPDDKLPTLAVTLGVSSCRLDVEAALQAVQSALRAGRLEVDLTGCAAVEGGELPSVEAILEDVAVEAVDARLELGTGQLVPGSYGVTADREALERQLKSAAPGQTIHVALEAEAPRVLGREAYFQDVLGFCQTPHSDNEKRNVNLKLACQALNGVVLEPGETLSYNATLGERTEEAGYQPAPAYSGVELVNTLGGGICQVSSTLYLCSLYAELETVERVSHGFPAGYMPVGLDATVSWGTPDLKIKNQTDYPVKIVAEIRDDFVRVWIMGTETRDHYVRMAFSSSSDGYARSYVVRYDRESNQQISREHCAFSSYFTKDLSASGEIGSEEIYRYGNVRQEPRCDPSPETLKAALDYQKPNTRG